MTWPHTVSEIGRTFGSFRNNKIMRARCNDRALLEWPDEEPLRLVSGLMMFGRQSQNYGHWFLEFLPRMLVFDCDVCVPDAPLMIDAGMPPTHVEALRLVNGRQRPVVEMPNDRVVRFGHLGIAPVPAFFPCDTVNGVTYDTVWPSDVFSTLRDRILRALDLPVGLDDRKGGRRLFISRAAYAQRQLVNEAEIAGILKSHGFEMILPERLSFADQVRSFNNAEIVIGSCNSALTNALFCRPGARMVGLIHDYPGFNFRGYASFMRAAGVQIRFLQGRTLFNPLVHPLHAAYSIEPDALIRGLAWAEQAT
jgi:capsular polysaccharide biosynthesis protein